MKNALTMIELIFVIIILGVLSATAIPKLQSTRDDAKISTIAQQLGMALSEILENYTSRGVIRKPHEMSQVLSHILDTGRAVETSVNQIGGSVGQLTIYSRNGVGGEDNAFVFDINQTTLVFKHGTPCVGIICKSLQSRVAEGNYSIGGSGIVF